MYRFSQGTLWEIGRSHVTLYRSCEGAGTVLRGVGAGLLAALADALQRGAAEPELTSLVAPAEAPLVAELLGFLAERNFVTTAVSRREPGLGPARPIVLRGSPELQRAVAEILLADTIATQTDAEAAIVAEDLVALIDRQVSIRETLESNLEVGCAGARFLSVRVMDRVVELGPFVIPGRTPCFACYWARLQADQRTDFTPPSLPTAALSRADQSIVAGIVAAELQRGLARSPTPPRTLGAVLRFDLASMETTRHPVVEVAACEACAAFHRLHVATT